MTDKLTLEDALKHAQASIQAVDAIQLILKATPKTFHAEILGGMLARTLDTMTPAQIAEYQTTVDRGQRLLESSGAKTRTERIYI